MNIQRENLPRPKTSKGNRGEIKIDKILNDLDDILTEPSQQRHSNPAPTDSAKKQEISQEETDELIKEDLRHESQVNLSRSATNSIVPPLDLEVANGPGHNRGHGLTTRRDDVPGTTKDHKICKHCGSRTEILNLTPYSSRVHCLKCGHSYEKSEKAEDDDIFKAVATSNKARVESPVDPTSRSNFVNTTRRSSEQSERDEYLEAESETAQKAKKPKHKKCRMCNTNKNSMRLMPCKHKFCAECASDLTECPVEKCKQKIEEKQAYHQRSKSTMKNKQNED